MWGWYHQMWEKKIRKPSNVTKVQSHVMLVLHNVRMVLSNVRKNKRTTKCDKSIVTCDVNTILCEEGTIKCDVLVTWYSRLPISGYHTPQKKGGTPYDVDIAQYEDDIIKCEKKIRKPSNVTKV